MSLTAPYQTAVSHLLLVEDQPDFAALVTTMLGSAYRRWEIKRADRLSGALESLGKGGIEAVLLDLMLPDATGLEAVDGVVRSFPDVAVVVMTSLDETLAAEALRRGAQDYIIKDEVNPSLLSRSLSYAVSRKRAELALRRSDARFRAAVEGSLDAVGILSAVRDEHGDVTDFVVTEINRNAERLLERRRDEVVSRRLSELWPLPSLHPFIARSVEVMRAHQALEEELGVTLPGAEGRWIHHQIVPLEDGVAIAVRDTTARHEAEARPPPARGAGPAVAEDGGDRPPGRGSGPRLQQPAHGDPRPRRAHAAQAGRATTRCGATSRRSASPPSALPPSPTSSSPSAASRCCSRAPSTSPRSWSA